MPNPTALEKVLEFYTEFHKGNRQWGTLKPDQLRIAERAKEELRELKEPNLFNNGKSN